MKKISLNKAVTAAEEVIDLWLKTVLIRTENLTGIMRLEERPGTFTFSDEFIEELKSRYAPGWNEISFGVIDTGVAGKRLLPITFS